MNKLTLSLIVNVILGIAVVFSVLNSKSTANKQTPKFSGSRVICMDSVRNDFNDKYSAFLSDSCKSNMSAVFCNASIKALIEVELTKKLENCIGNIDSK